MSAFDLLRSEIKTYIWEQGWPKLRNIQEHAITQFANSDSNLILAAPTASGKTEAAFLPAINSVQDWQTGVKIIYISPLIALINDQFKRVSELCEYLNVPVTSWHGEASQAQKRKLLKQPSGIVLITPESIEGLLARKPAQARQLFSGTECVIIDELHSFLDSQRGVHLQSLLQRLRSLADHPPRYIGLSATLSKESYALSKTFFGLSQNTTVLVDSSRNELTVTLRHYKNSKQDIPSAIIDDIYQRSQAERMLVFPNTRGRVEEIAVRLQKRAKKDHSSVRYFAHHASVDKELRIEAEHFAKTARNELFTICCTSTLELGIDIGSVDSVAQVDATFSVSSLAQRLGRSGRLRQHSILHTYTTDQWSLLQTITCIELFKQGLLEPIVPIAKPYEVLFQQILSVLLEKNSLCRADLVAQLSGQSYWQLIAIDEIELLVDHMLTTELLEDVDGELVVGIAAERITESRGFYAHFESSQEYRVLNDSQHIGDIPKTPAVAVGENIFLAARIWKITSIDDQTRKMFVSPAKDGRPPVFGGEGGEVSHLLRQSMRMVLQDREAQAGYADEAALSELKDIGQAVGVTVDDAALRIQKHSGDKESLTTFAGTRINKTIMLYLDMSDDGERPELNDHATTIKGKDLSVKLRKVIGHPPSIVQVESWLKNNPEKRLGMMAESKYARYLPEELQVRSVIYNSLDLVGANQFLKVIQA